MVSTSFILITHDSKIVVGSAFMLGRTISAMFWRMVYDYIGRKHVIVMGLISVYVYMSH
jgi:MFS family permease